MDLVSKTRRNMEDKYGSLVCSSDHAEVSFHCRNGNYGAPNPSMYLHTLFEPSIFVEICACTVILVILVDKNSKSNSTYYITNLMLTCKVWRSNVVLLGKTKEREIPTKLKTVSTMHTSTDLDETESRRYYCWMWSQKIHSHCRIIHFQ
jgi:hypothetical protein